LSFTYSSDPQLENIGVRSSANHEYAIPAYRVDQQPVRLDMQIAMILPIAPKRMISITAWKNLSSREEIEHLPVACSCPYAASLPALHLV
jgi:hypothetical protein